MPAPYYEGLISENEHSEKCIWCYILEIASDNCVNRTRGSAVAFGGKGCRSRRLPKALDCQSGRSS